MLLRTAHLTEKVNEDNVNLSEILTQVEQLVGETETTTTFHKFVECRALEDDTWKLWKQFVFEDCLAYATLYTAIRSSN